MSSADSGTTTAGASQARAGDRSDAAQDGRAVLFLCIFFPLVSETFIFDQMAALRAAGRAVAIVALWRAPGGVVQEKVAQFRLLDLVRYCLPGRGKAAQVAGVLRALAVLGATRPLTLCRLVSLKTKGRSWKDLAWLILYGAAVRNQRNAAVVANFGPMGRVATDLRMLGLIAGPVVTYFHGIDVSELPRKHGRGYYDALFAQGERFLIASPHFRSQLVALGCPGERIQYVPVGIDVAAFPPRAPRQAQTGAPFRLLSVARLTEKKGHRFVLEAIARIAPRHAVTYTVIGDGPLLEPLRAEARRLGVDRLVSFLGPRGRSDVVAALEECDAVVQASITTASGDQEAVPLALKEAMARGAPVLATTHGGIPELIQDGENGLLAPERDAAALAARLVELIEQPALRARLAASGRATITSAWDNAVLMPRFVALVAGLAAAAAYPAPASGRVRPAPAQPLRMSTP